MIQARLFAPLAMASVALLGCDQLAAARDPSHGAVAACEEIAKARLVSPSSYKLVRATYSPGMEMPMPLYRLSVDKSYNPNCGDGFCEDAQRFTMVAAARMMLQEEGIKQPSEKQTKARIERIYREGFANLQDKPVDQRKVALTRIEFDAQNSYGALIRQEQSCMFAPKRGAIYEPTDAFGTSQDAELSWLMAGSADSVELH